MTSKILFMADFCKIYKNVVFFRFFRFEAFSQILIIAISQNSFVEFELKNSLLIYRVEYIIWPNNYAKIPISPFFGTIIRAVTTLPKCNTFFRIFFIFPKRNIFYQIFANMKYCLKKRTNGLKIIGKAIK